MDVTKKALLDFKRKLRDRESEMVAGLADAVPKGLAKRIVRAAIKEANAYALWLSKASARTYEREVGSFREPFADYAPTIADNLAEAFEDIASQE